MTGDIFSREELLLGRDAMARLAAARVIVFGVGGVGGAAFEALLRGGVGEIHVVDPDTVALSNLNRQTLARLDTVGMKKTEAARRLAEQINPECRVVEHGLFYTPQDKGGIVLSDFDYVIDAIDTVSSKLALIEEASASGVPIVCSMGTGNKLDPARLTLSDIYKTNTCPLAATVRRECRKRGIKHLDVVWSDEPPRRCTAEESFGRHAPGSISFVPPVAGMIAAGAVIRSIAGVQ